MKFITLTLISLVGVIITLFTFKIQKELEKVENCKIKNFYYGQNVKSYDSFFNGQELKVIGTGSFWVKVQAQVGNTSHEFSLDCNLVEDAQLFIEEEI